MPAPAVIAALTLDLEHHREELQLAIARHERARIEQCRLSIEGTDAQALS